MKILLVLPAASHLRMTSDRQKVPKRAMKRFSILPLTQVAAVTPAQHRALAFALHVLSNRVLDFGQPVLHTRIMDLLIHAPRRPLCCESAVRFGNARF